MNSKSGIFISGESGVIPLALQKILKTHKDYYVVNDRSSDVFNINELKTHNSFAIRETELDFTDRTLLFSKQLEEMWSNTEIIIHSGAFVGTDYCKVEPHKTIDVNTTGTSNLLEIAKKYNIKFIYFSTTAVFDPDFYGEYCPIDENTKIRPKTLYGITKYAGEQIVDRLYESSKSMIIRPVFGFSDYPDDLHSALTKLIYVLYKKSKGETIDLEILLDELIGKNYTRVENIAHYVIKLIENDAWGHKINVGDHYSSRINWHEMFEIISKYINLDSTTLSDIENVIFKKEEDYLHWHNIDNKKLLTLINGDIENYISFEDGVKSVVESLEKNHKIKPYWI